MFHTDLSRIDCPIRIVETVSDVNNLALTTSCKIGYHSSQFILWDIRVKIPMATLLVDGEKILDTLF